MVRTHAPIHIEDLPAGKLVAGITACGEYFNIEEQLPVIIIHPDFLDAELPSCEVCWRKTVDQIITDAGTHHV